MLLISIEQMLSFKATQMIPVKCDYCQQNFEKMQKYIKSNLKLRSYKNHFCSNACSVKAKDKRKEVTCRQCDKAFLKTRNQLKKHPNSFCSSSCAATYNNTHKTHGCRRSKMEIYFEQALPNKYPNLEFHFNRKDTINSELDIYIPILKLAFELNGIFHYEPIYGLNKLDQIKNNDQRKFQACLEKSIELCIIDTSSLNYFKPDKAQKYLDIIVNIINSKL
jgi:hypothetical protein